MKLPCEDFNRLNSAAITEGGIEPPLFAPLATPLLLLRMVYRPQTFEQEAVLMMLSVA